MSTSPAKDTIYIDAEDEITAIIEKVRASEAKVVALVLPKRSATLQSIVNLKLLKRMATEAKKNLVLITSEASLLPLAGSVGLHVAKTLQSKPSVPPTPKPNDAPIKLDSDQIPDTDIALDPNATVGQLAGQLATEDTIELDNETLPAATVKATPPKMKRDKKLKIPDFDRFRLLLFGIAGLLILLIIAGYFALAVLPKAKVTIKTNTSSVTTDLKLTADSQAKSINAEQAIVPALSKQVKKSDNEKVPATGKRDEGTKASGKITITNCSPDVVNLAVGTVFSSGTFSFLSTEAAAVPKSSYSFTTGGFVCDKNGTQTINVVAQSGGDSYNLGARSYQIGGNPTNVTAAGSDMKGGTSKIVQIVSQDDVNAAKQKVIERMGGAAGNDLKTQFSTDGAQALADTLTPGDPAVTSSPNVNDAASDVTVTVAITYSQLGVKQDDLKQLIEADIKKHIDNNQQVIQDNGLAKATIRLLDKVSASQARFEVQTVAIAGPQLDADGIKQQIAGKKKGATQSLIQARPGIRDVDIKYSPFWVHSTPKKLSHITIVFQQSNE